MLAPEPIMRGALRVLYVAGYTTRNWTLSEVVPRTQLNDLWEALHEIPDLLTRWKPEAEAVLIMYLREYNAKWPEPNLMAIFKEEQQQT